jgi:hypothetical protein
MAVAGSSIDRVRATSVARGGCGACRLVWCSLLPFAGNWSTGSIAHRCVRHPDQYLCVQFVPFTIPGYEYMIVHDDLDPRDGALVSFEHEE